MPRTLHRALTDEKIRTCGFGKHYDGRGLLLHHEDGGAKVFRFRSQRGGKESWRVLGRFPQLTLSKARVAAERARVELSASPIEAPKGIAFEEAFESWHHARAMGWTPHYAAEIRGRLTFTVLSALRARPINAITRVEVIAVLETITERGAHEQARRVRALLHDIFEFAIIREWCNVNPATKAILKTLPRRSKVKHHAAAKFSEIETVVKAIRLYPSRVTGAALEFLILTAARTTEVRLAKWDELDLTKKLWTIPPERMKASALHLVPLSSRAVELLQSLPRLSQTLVFPSLRAERPMSDNAMLFALKAMGFTFTVHGFRSTFSTWANDHRVVDQDIIEAALAHTVGGVKGAYDRGDRLAQRVQLMQRWADAIARSPREKG